MRQQLVDLKIVDSSTYLNLSSRQMGELDKLRANLQSKDKFSLLGRNMQVVQIQSLVNTNLFLTSFKNSSNTTFSFKTSKNVVSSVKVKKVLYKGLSKLSNYGRKKLFFFKNPRAKLVKIRKKLTFKDFFKSLTGTKRTHHTRSLLPSNGNSLLLVFT
tara:strand:+ start:157 stop:630 length:474 start_codon:yes stop_codon:yes gene_type:complete